MKTISGKYSILSGNIRGVDLSQYREGFAFRRLRLQIQAAKCQNYLDYIKLLQEKPEEFNRFWITCP